MQLLFLKRNTLAGKELRERLLLLTRDYIEPYREALALFA
jgi:hypothetical protein